MRGSLPNWIWIAGGLIAGLLIFISAYQMLSDTTEVMSEQEALEPYNQIVSLVEDDLCYSAPGNKRYLDIELSESISAIYFTDDKYTKYTDDELLEKVLTEETTNGSLICLKQSGIRLECEELSCPVKMKIIGAVPTEESLSALIDRIFGRHETFSYNLVLERKSENVEVTVT